MKFKSAVFSIFMIFSAVTGTFATDESSEYIDTFDSIFTFRPSISYNQLSLVLYKDNNQELIEYLPNSVVFYGADLSYGNFGVGSKFETPGSKKSEAKYGKTKARDIQSYYYSRKYGFDFFYQNYEGFYSASSGSGFVQDIRDDMKMLNVAVTAYYVFSDKFSLKAAFKQSERQKKFAYSFFLGLSASYFRVKSNRSLIPTDFEIEAGEFSGYTGGKYMNLSILPGFGFTHIFKPNWSGTLIGMMGGGISNTESNVAKGKIKRLDGTFKALGKYSAGYNSEILFFGASVLLDLTAINVFRGSTVAVGSGVIFIEGFAGVRI